MVDRQVRFDIEQPVDFRLTDVRNSARLRGQTVNISAGGVLFKTDEKIGVGRKIELVVRVARLSPESKEVDLHFLGRTVRSSGGCVAVQIVKRQILARAG